MSDAKYVFDSCCFIETAKNQPIDVFPIIWSKFDELMTEGLIISSEEVLKELERRDDDLYKWVKERSHAFIDSDLEIQQRVRAILAEHRQLVEGGKRKNTADPFIIAVAMSVNGKVVTLENANDDKQVKVPHVCKAYGIPFLSLVEFYKENNIKF